MLTRAEIQQIRSLAEARERRSQGRFLVEGPKVVEELLAGGACFEKIYALADWEAQVPAGIPVIRVGTAEMARISHFPTPSLVLAVGKWQEPELPENALGRGWTLALDGVQDPGNVGTLLRIADWFALDRVLLSEGCADPYSQKVINASMGSLLRVPVHRVALADRLATAGVAVFGCSLDGVDIATARRPSAGVIVIGSEGRGLSEAVSRLVSQRITIPRLGKAESLNAAVAAGIVCAHFRLGS